MTAHPAGIAKPDGGQLETIKPGRLGAVRDVRLNGHFAGRFGRRAAVQVDAVELSLSAGDLDPDLRYALAYWQQKRGARLAPARIDIDPLDITPLLPRVMLVDVTTAPLDFRFRLAGTGIFKIHGAELTNKRPLDLDPPAYAQLLHRLYAEAVTRRSPVAHRLLIEVETRRSAYARIILPLSEDGVDINRLMTVESYADSAQDLRDCFEEARRGAGR